MYLSAKRNLPEEFALVGDFSLEFQRRNFVAIAGYESAPDAEREIYKIVIRDSGLERAADPETPSAVIVSDDDDERDAYAAEVVIGYWRKANHIHAWFVEHVQGGKDECQPFAVTREQLLALREICMKVLTASKLAEGEVKIGQVLQAGETDWKQLVRDGQVIANPEIAEEHLPTQSGFFFGGTDYDQFYLHDVLETVDIIDRALALPEDTTFEYQSSW
jgi:hypothetical protein